MAGFQEIIVKAFAPDMAGERVGWLATREEEHRHGTVLYIDGGYATVAEQGGEIVFRAEEDDGDAKTRLYDRYDVVRGLTNACAWSFGAVKETSGEWDASGIKNQPTVRIAQNDQDSAADEFFAGVLRGKNTIALDDEKSVTWSVGDDEIVECIKHRLEQHEAQELYTPMYLSINGIAGALAVRDQEENYRSASFGQIAAYQLADPAHAKLTEREHNLVQSYDDRLLARMKAGKLMTKAIREETFMVDNAKKFESAVRSTEVASAALYEFAVLPQKPTARTRLPEVGPVLDLSRGIIDTRGVSEDVKQLENWRSRATSPWRQSLHALHAAEVGKIAR